MRDSIIKIQNDKAYILISFVILFSNIYKALVTFLKFPSAISYLLDIVWIVFLFIIIKTMTNYNTDKENRGIISLIILFWIGTIMSWGMNLYSPLLYMWGFRNLFRFYIFLLACILFFQARNIYSIYKMLYILLVINAVFCTIEYFVLHYTLDTVSGLFTAGASVRGGNASLNVLMCIVCTIALALYFEKKKSLVHVALPIILSLYMSTIAEIKAFYIEFAIILISCSLLTKFSLKKLYGLVLAAIGMVIAVRYYYMLFPNFEDIFSLSNLLSYVGTDGSGYGPATILNRTTAAPYMMKNFMTTLPTKLFGIGLGNADYATASSLLTSSFYLQYGYLCYTWWLLPMLLIENGIIGVLLYILILAYVFIKTTMIKKYANEERAFLTAVQTFSILGLMLMVYNQSLRLDTAGYVFYFWMAVPFIIQRDLKVGQHLCIPKSKVVKIRFI